jgi:hypothetical protein
VQEQQRQQCPLTDTGERHDGDAVVDLERTKDPELQFELLPVKRRSGVRATLGLRVILARNAARRKELPCG